MKHMVSGLDVHDIRFPRTEPSTGSGTATCVVLSTEDGHRGHGFCFHSGHDGQACAAAISTRVTALVGRKIDTDDLGELSRLLTFDVPAGAAGAVVNAAFDLASQAARVPLWKLLAGYRPAQLIDLVDWRTITDVLTPRAALDLLQEQAAGKAERERMLRRHGLPAYATISSSSSDSDDDLIRLVRSAVTSGYTYLKLKFSNDPREDARRFGLARETAGPQVRVCVDVSYPDGEMPAGGPYWISSSGPAVGFPGRIAAGAQATSQVMVKQLLAGGAISVLEPDACRIGAITEIVAILLLAASFEVPVCLQGGEYGFHQTAQHLAMLDFVAVSGSTDGRALEYTAPAGDYFDDPVRIATGRYLAPGEPGASTSLRPHTLAKPW